MRKKLIDTGVIVMITGLLFCFLELGLRLLFPEQIWEVQLARKRIQETPFRFDPDYLVGLKPSFSKSQPRTAANGGEVIHWSTNSQGFRGPELTIDPDLRVIVYGDSNIQAVFSNLENTFAYRLQTYLRALSGRQVEVINAGVMGSGPDQMLIRFEQEAERIRPQIALFHVFADNDFGDIIRNRLFSVNAEGALEETRIKKDIDLALLRPKEDLLIVRAARTIGRTLLGTPAPKHYELPDADTMLSISRHEFDVYKKGGVRLFSHFDDHYDIDIAVDPHGEAAREKVRLMEAVLRRAAAVAERHGIWLIVVIQPSVMDMTENMAVNFNVLSQFPQYDRLRLASLVEEICARAGIPFVNLYPVFERNRPESLFFRVDDNHWNDAGQAVAAEEVAGYIFAQWSAKRGWHSRDATISGDGDDAS